jgi:N-methylhydantoinase A
VHKSGVSAPINIMSSNGGAMTLASAAERCAATFLSGPVGGVGGAVRVGAVAGVRDLITFDMGGTSTDVALVHDLSPRMSYDNQFDAYPLRMPQLDIHTIGAGGGSIVWAGPDRTLRIGPQSAGAVPGPACYGRGGTEPTISDANLLLGRLSPARPLAGGLRLDMAAAEAAFRTLAETLRVDDLVALAEAAVAVAVAKMAGAVREVSVHRGFDPRDCTLVCFGGAGPMHGFQVADELGMERVLVPRFPGHLSALGQMLADVRRDFVKPWGGRLSELPIAALNDEVRELEERGTKALIAEGIQRGRHRHELAVDMRYWGQSFTLPIPSPLEVRDFEPLRQAFHARHEETFGFADKTNDMEIVNLRLVSIGAVDKPRLDFQSPAGGKPEATVGRVWFGGWRETAIYHRSELPVSFALNGPAILEEEGGTTIVPPGWNVVVDASGALLGKASHG